MIVGSTVLYLRKALKMNFPVFQEHGVIARVLDADNHNERVYFQQFRYKYWVKEFNIVPESENDEQLEYDKYDEHSIHFGVFDPSQRMVGYSRLILPGQHGLQVHNAYEELVHPRVGGFTIDLSKCVESSRLTAIPEIGAKRRHVTQLLFKLKYQFIKRLGFEHWYLVAEKKYIRALWLLQRYPFEIIGEGKEYLGAVRYPAVMSLSKVESLILRERPQHYQWMNEGLEDNISRQDVEINMLGQNSLIITDILRQGL